MFFLAAVAACQSGMPADTEQGIASTCDAYALPGGRDFSANHYWVFWMVEERGPGIHDQRWWRVPRTGGIARAVATTYHDTGAGVRADGYGFWAFGFDSSGYYTAGYYTRDGVSHGSHFIGRADVGRVAADHLYVERMLELGDMDIVRFDRDDVAAGSELVAGGGVNLGEYAVGATYVYYVEGQTLWKTLRDGSGEPRKLYDIPAGMLIFALGRVHAALWFILAPGPPPDTWPGDVVRLAAITGEAHTLLHLDDASRTTLQMGAEDA